MKQRFIRTGDELPDDVAVVVRGGDLEPDILREDALRNYAIYGSYGISVFAVRDLTLDELAQQVPLVRFQHLAIVRVGALRALGAPPRADREKSSALRCELRRPR